jgi:uncharacterized protein YdiU (UPF0061 family)
MTTSVRSLFTFDNSFVRALPGLYTPWHAVVAPDARLVALNEDLAAELGVDADALRSPDGVAVLVGSAVPDGAEPVAQAYSGHQFGGYSPRLGDGRALLVGEVIDPSGTRRDLHLKGSGRTPYARGGDGKAALGPMLRELVIGEAMHALGVPTTRALAVVATGETIAREQPLPGAVLARIASSHLRVGSFQFAAARDDHDLLRRLTTYAIERHYPHAASTDDPALSLLHAVIEAQASLVSQWMLVGFVHGVMNTDNVTISGETIDYGPCAFMDAYDPATVFSSIDHQGRYAYGNQPQITQWNLARLAEALLPLIDGDPDRAVAAANDALAQFAGHFQDAWETGRRAKLGLTEAHDHDAALSQDLLTLLHDQQIDYTGAHRALSSALRDDDDPIRALFGDDTAPFDAWIVRWHERLALEGRDRALVARELDRVNPVYIPRNHMVEAALAAASGGDLQPVGQLIEALGRPYEQRPGFEAYEAAAPASFGDYRTFCGT